MKEQQIHGAELYGTLVQPASSEIYIIFYTCLKYKLLTQYGNSGVSHSIDNTQCLHVLTALKILRNTRRFCFF